jgi:hypothetical protein
MENRVGQNDCLSPRLGLEKLYKAQSLKPICNAPSSVQQNQYNAMQAEQKSLISNALLCSVLTYVL